MTGKQLQEWAGTLRPEAQVELNMMELARMLDWHTYKDQDPWVELDLALLRAVQIPPERKAKLVSERLVGDNPRLDP